MPFGNVFSLVTLELPIIEFLDQIGVRKKLMTRAVKIAKACSKGNISEDIKD